MGIALLITLAGIAAGFVLFWQLPKLGGALGGRALAGQISVIIPARNEEATLGLLLADLAAQTLAPLEILCVDDASTDKTGEIALQHGARLISITQKPAGWTGKTYACALGAGQAQGRVLLFLDADVRLAPGGLARIAAQYHKSGCTITAQPYHRPGSAVEQLSLLFNLIAGCTLASSLPFGRTPGFYGPVLMMDRDTYAQVGGHGAVRHSVVEDLDLGLEMDKLNLPYQRFLGGKAVSFRMYAGGLVDLFQGFVKNFSLGAAKTSVPVLLLIVLWVSALCRVPIELFAQIGALVPAQLALYGGLYILLVVQLIWAAGKIGRFWPATMALYPLCLVFFVLVFAVSLYKKLFRRPVKWKGREIQLGKGK